MTKGINFVPNRRFKDKDILKNVESDLKLAAIQHFRDSYKFYPNIDQNSSLQNVLGQLISQSVVDLNKLIYFAN